MRRDPVRTNLLENTGGYLWQLAEYVMGVHGNDPVTLIRKPPQPRLRDGAAPWAQSLPGESIVRWAPGVQVRHQVRTPLLARRGTTVVLASNVSTAAFVEVAPDVATALSEGFEVGSVDTIEVFGTGLTAGDAVVGLVRHGLLTVSTELRAPSVFGMKREPFVILNDDHNGLTTVTNPLNGRFLRLNAAAASLLAELDGVERFVEEPSEVLVALAFAGIVRFVGAPS